MGRKPPLKKAALYGFTVGENLMRPARKEGRHRGKRLLAVENDQRNELTRRLCHSARMCWEGGFSGGALPDSHCVVAYDIEIGNGWRSRFRGGPSLECLHSSV